MDEKLSPTNLLRLLGYKLSYGAFSWKHSLTVCEILHVVRGKIHEATHEIPTYLDDMNSTLVQKAVSFQQNRGLVSLSSPNPFTYYYMPC